MATHMKKSHKIILAFSVFLVAGYTWSIDMPLALEVPLRQEPYNFSNFDFNFLYFATYIAICFCDMPLGMLLDKLPIRKTIICIGLISLISQLGILLMFYLEFPGYKIFVYIFRGVFGVMGQALFTIQSLLVSKYSGKYYDMIIGIGFCAPFWFDSINNILTPYLFDLTHSMQLIWGIGSLLCLFAFVFSLIISNLVSKQEQIKKQKRIKSKKSIHSSQSQSVKDTNIQTQSIHSQEQSAKSQDSLQQADQQINFNGLKTMPRQFWVIVGAVFFTQNVIATYIDNLNDSIVKRFQISYVNAGYLMFIPFGAGAVIAFVIGLILQKKPTYRRKIMVSSTVFYSVGLLSMYLLPNVLPGQQASTIYYIVIGIQFVSVSYQLANLYGVLSSAIVYIISQKHLGIGWGVIGSTIGLSEAIGPIVCAWILDSETDLQVGYKKLTLYTFSCSLLALGFSLWILLGDFASIDVNSSQKLIEVYQQEEDNLQESLIQSQT